MEQSLTNSKAQTIYLTSALLLTLSSLSFGILAAVEGPAWEAVRVLPGILAVAGLWLETRRPFPAVLIVLGAGAYIGAAEATWVFPPIFTLLLLGSRFWIGRGKVLQRRKK